MMETIFSYLNSHENLELNRVSKWFGNSVAQNWERRAFDKQE